MISFFCRHISGSSDNRIRHHLFCCPLPKYYVLHYIHLFRRSISMSSTENLQLFEDQPIRTAWSDEEEEWYFSIVDVVGVLTDQTTQRILINMVVFSIL